MNESAPIACTLTPAGLAAQAGRWKRLIARAGTERTETAAGLRMSFRPDAEDELRALVAIEAACCHWATWTVKRTAGTVVLDVRSAAAGTAVLHGMFRADLAGPSAGRTSASPPGPAHQDGRR
jgi:hypothetical protein